MDFTFVGDVVEANIIAAQSGAAGVLNIGGGKSISINNLAGTILEFVGKDLQPIYRKPRPGDVRHSQANITEARGFGYNPKYSLEGLRQTIHNSL